MKSLFFTLAFLLQFIRTLAQNFMVSGTIKDDNDDTLMGAVVTLIHDGKIVDGLVTHYNGYFCFSPSKPGCYDVAISYPGYMLKTIRDIDLRKKDTLLDVHIWSQRMQEVVIYYQMPLISCGYRTGCVFGDEYYYFPPPAKQLSVFPNPTSGIINIDLQESDGTLYITDMAGRTVVSVAAKREMRSTLDLSGLPDGTYVATYTYKPAGKMSVKFQILH